jgi:hypothetical protein
MSATVEAPKAGGRPGTGALGADALAAGLLAVEVSVAGKSEDTSRARR